jgi:glycosyltransferase involved in cell wall biosynthesis
MSYNDWLNEDGTDAYSVSVVIPCYNEERNIGKALDCLLHQFDPRRYEIIIVDGDSEDRTREAVEAIIKKNPDITIRLVHIKERNIPYALNCGIEKATGSIIVRMDAHSLASTGYVQRCVETLTTTDASVVGMPWRIRPGADNLIAEVIAMAVSNPFGIGDAKYRRPHKVKGRVSVDTVPFGAFRKGLWQRLGGYNERLLTNEDYDFNYRTRIIGGSILLDSTEYSEYMARSTIPGLAKQYFRYGYWKAQMISLHPKSVRWRHAAAPAFLLSIIVFTLGSLTSPVIYNLLAAELGVYFAASAVASATLIKQKTARSKMLIFLCAPIVFATLHFSWATGFLVSCVSQLQRHRPSQNQLLEIRESNGKTEEEAKPFDQERAQKTDTPSQRRTSRSCSRGG